MVRIKVTRGRESLNLCRYVLQPEKVFRSDDDRGSSGNPILGNMVGKTPEYLAQEFWISQSLKPRVNVNIVNYSVSFPPGEDVDDSTVDRMSRSMLKRMGHSAATQFFAVRHFDQQRKNNVSHFHVVASSIGLDGQVCRSSWERTRLKKVSQELEVEFSLSQHPVVSSPRNLTTGEFRQRARTKQKTTKEKLWEAIDREVEDRPTLEELGQRLLKNGIELKVKIDEATREAIGVSYGMEGKAFAGYRLGQRYTLRGLIEELGVSRNPQPQRQRSVEWEY
jgi:multidrug efflux pump subunit AcrB